MNRQTYASIHLQLSLLFALYNYTMLTVQDISTGFAQEASPYPLKRAYLFGSQARGNASHDSDIDIFLDVKEGFSLFDLCGLTNALGKRFGVSCDVVTRNELKDSIRTNAEKDGILIYEHG